MVFTGYDEARDIEREICKIVKEHKITKKNGLAWLNFFRQIETVCDIQKERILKVLGRI